MKFFDQGGNQIEFNEWLATYEPYYFLGGPKDHVRNKTSHFVEDRICSLLRKTEALSRADLTLAMAWKIGAIDHFESELKREIVYFPPDWFELPIEPRYKRYDYSLGIQKLAEQMADISWHVNHAKPQYLYDMHRHLEGFASVYILTVLFFVSHGKFPIYDKFVDIAVQAIHEDLRPGAKIRYKEITRWSDYAAYMRKLSAVKAFDPENDHSMFITHNLDRALWVYGHFFPDEKSKVLPKL